MKYLGLFRILALLAIFALPAIGWATEKPRITLLISLDPALYPKGVASWLHDYPRYPEILERTFRESLSGSEFDLTVVQNANRYDLYQALHAPENIAVFWVSHEAPIRWAKKTGLRIDPFLVDHERADVKDVFREIDPHIRWVSLVACDSQLVIDWLKHSVSDQGTAVFHGFEKPVDANKGLRESIKQSLQFFSVTPDEPEDVFPAVSVGPQTGKTIQVTRTLDAGISPALFPAVTIEQNGRMIGAFQERRLAPGEHRVQTQEMILEMPDGKPPGARTLKLEVISGFDPAVVPADFNLGSFQVTANWAGAEWKTFAKPDGTPFGLTERVLLYSGDTSENATDYATFASSTWPE